MPLDRQDEPPRVRPAASGAAGPGTAGRTLSPWAAGATVFGASAAVLVLEILAMRLLAPYTGLTLETYTAVIGVILGGISLGSFSGGRAADRVDPRRLLGPILLAGGVLAVLSLPTVRIFGPRAPGSDP